MPMTGRKKILFSSVCQPFGTKYGDGFGVSSEGSHQLQWAQGVFRTRATTNQWSIDFIAANIEAPTTTLHYPTMAQFIAEVKKGYDYVGIAFVTPTLHKMIPMTEAVRRYAPKSKIILGGYGTAIGDELIPHADYICKGEGVAFMRELLGEPLDAPYVQPVITQVTRLFSIPLSKPTGYIFAGLGCPNGCDFCATSHYFNRKHIRLLPEGRSIVDAIHRLRELHPYMDKFWVSDEDLLLNQRRGRAFLEAIRESDLPPLSLGIFGSVKGLSQYKMSELVEMGIDTIWIGFEGKRAGYAKMVGRSYPELFADLREHGISVIASMIIGFDYQTPEIIEKEFEELMSLRPAMSQFLIYGPPYGTPLRERLMAEGRMLPEFVADRSTHDGFSPSFVHPHIGNEEMVALQRRLYEEDFRRLGPTVFRIVDNQLAGCVALRDHADPRVRAKALRYRKDTHRAQMLIPASRKYLELAINEKLEDLRQRLARETGALGIADRLLAKAVPALLRYTQFKVRHDIGQQPEFTRRTFHMDGAADRASAPARAVEGGQPAVDAAEA